MNFIFQFFCQKSNIISIFFQPHKNFVNGHPINSACSFVGFCLLVGFVQIISVKYLFKQVCTVLFFDFLIFDTVRFCKLFVFHTIPFCSSDRGFASDFLQTPPHDECPCLWLTVPTAKPVTDFHRQVITHAERTQKNISLVKRVRYFFHKPDSTTILKPSYMLFITKSVSAETVTTSPNFLYFFVFSLL